MIKAILRKMFVVSLTLVLAFSCDVGVYASGGQNSDESQAVAAKLPQEELKTIGADSYILTEMKTGAVLFEKNADNKICSGHFNKLMVLLLLAREIDSGRVKAVDVFTATDNANAQKDPQIWLNRNEEITVDELIKAITVGNANDAAVTAAENLSDSLEKFVSLMNETADELGMKATVYVDCTGLAKENTTTARDLSVLCAELEKYEFLKPYFKTWMVNVRQGKAELVNSNRLVRNYSGITGMKAFASKEYGSCGCITAEKSRLQLCAVVIGCKDNDSRDADAKTLLKVGAQCYQLYSPEVPKEMLESIPVTHGQELECELELENKPVVVIKRGTSAELEKKTKREKTLEAPVEKGQVCAEYQLLYQGNSVCTVNIVSKRKVERMNWACGVKKLLYSLIGF